MAVTVANRGAVINAARMQTTVGHQFSQSGGSGRVVVINSVAKQRAAWAKQVSARLPFSVSTAVQGTSTNPPANVIVIDWSGIPGVDEVNVYRVTPDGVRTLVRGSPALLSGGFAVFWDTEAPLNTVIYYVVTSPDSTLVLTTNSTTLTETAYGWLRDPVHPSNDIHLTSFTPGGTGHPCSSATAIGFKSLADEDYDDATGVFNIINASRPVTVAQLRKDLTSNLALVTRQLTDRALLLTLLSQGSNLLLQFANTTYGWATDTYASDYITVANVKSARPPSTHMTTAEREWSLPIQASDPPANDSTGHLGGNAVGVPGATWADLLASGQTWAAHLATGNTWMMTAEGFNY